jgi:hypothetical protein
MKGTLGKVCYEFLTLSGTLVVSGGEVIMV